MQLFHRIGNAHFFLLFFFIVLWFFIFYGWDTNGTSCWHYLYCTCVGSLSDEGGAVSSEEELSGGEMEAQESQLRGEDRELKDRLLRRFGSHISTLKLEFSKKKKKGKLPKDARQALLDWWNVHYKWPYPTVRYSYKFSINFSFVWLLSFLLPNPIIVKKMCLFLNNIQEADKLALAETTGLDQKQINNWFINQRKRHWKPSENMQFDVIDNLSGQFFTND